MVVRIGIEHRLREGIHVSYVTRVAPPEVVSDDVDLVICVAMARTDSDILLTYAVISYLRSLAR